MAKYFIYFVLYLLPCTYVIAQSDATDLIIYQEYFENQIKEYKIWLEKTGLTPISNIHTFDVYTDKVVLTLQSSYATDDSLKAYWNANQREFYRNNNHLISDKLFEQFIFLLDLLPNQAEIVIVGKQFHDSYLKIHYTTYLQVEENFPSVMAAGTVNIKLDELKFSNTESKLKVDGDKSELISEIRRNLSHFLIDYYEDKGTYWYTAQVDTSKTFYNTFTYIITCLNNEIISEGHYEFIKYNITIERIENTISVQYDISGKFAAGIFCPKQREAIYKPIESYYPGALDEYANDMKNRINDKLLGH